LESKKNTKTNESQVQKQVKSNETPAVIIATKTDRFGNEIPLSKSDLERDDKVHAKSKHKKVDKILFLLKGLHHSKFFFLHWQQG
jgi:hypothetical protein